jgi:hypothetical protein
LTRNKKSFFQTINQLQKKERKKEKSNNFMSTRTMTTTRTRQADTSSVQQQQKSESIETIKLRLREPEGIPPDQKRLSFKGESTTTPLSCVIKGGESSTTPSYARRIRRTPGFMTFNEACAFSAIMFQADQLNRKSETYKTLDEEIDKIQSRQARATQKEDEKSGDITDSGNGHYAGDDEDVASYAREDDYAHFGLDSDGNPEASSEPEINVKRRKLEGKELKEGKIYSSLNETQKDARREYLVATQHTGVRHSINEEEEERKVDKDCKRLLSNESFQKLTPLYSDQTEFKAFDIENNPTDSEIQLPCLPIHWNEFKRENRIWYLWNASSTETVSSSTEPTTLPVSHFIVRTALLPSSSQSSSLTPEEFGRLPLFHLRFVKHYELFQDSIRVDHSSFAL